MLRDGLNAETVFSFYLQSVHADVLFAEVFRILDISGNDACLV